jgi:hypothetical protein
MPKLFFLLRCIVGPRPSFEETLVKCDHPFWTSTDWSKMERLGGAEILGSHLICGPNKGFIRVYKMLAHGFTHD